MATLRVSRYGNRGAGLLYDWVFQFYCSTTADNLKKFLLEHKVIPVFIKKAKEK